LRIALRQLPKDVLDQVVRIDLFSDPTADGAVDQALQHPADLDGRLTNAGADTAAARLAWKAGSFASLGGVIGSTVNFRQKPYPLPSRVFQYCVPYDVVCDVNPVNAGKAIADSDKMGKIHVSYAFAYVGKIAARTLKDYAAAVQPKSQQSKYVKSATAAVRKQLKFPHATVSHLKVAEGFAVGSVLDTSVSPQGFLAYFKLNRDGSMTVLASGSEINPIDLLDVGIPLATQATLARRNVGQVKQRVFSECDYNGGNVPGYYGFGGSFGSKYDWELDAGTVDRVEQTLSDTISRQNATTESGKRVVCVNVGFRDRKNSTLKVDKKTYVATMTLRVGFITSSGALTHHTLKVAWGFPDRRWRYTLDGRRIS
jgi:hypothetical protein